MSAPRRPLPLVGRLRRVGFLFALFILVLMATVHWIVGDIRASVIAAVPAGSLVSHVDAAAGRIDAALTIAGVALVPVLLLAASLVRRYVGRHHLQELAEASFRKSQFVAMATYELRAPLTQMESLVDLMVSEVSGRLEPGQRQAANLVQAQIRNARRLLNDILDQTFIEAGRVELRRSAVMAQDLFREAAETAQIYADRQSVTLQVACDRGLELDADRIRLRQVVTTLLVRAVNACPVGELVRCDVEAVGGRIVASVSQPGPVWTAEEAQALFAEIRSVRSAEAVREGRDLDFAVCRQLIELHGGVLRAEAPAGGGSRLILDLPRNAVAGVRRPGPALIKSAA